MARVVCQLLDRNYFLVLVYSSLGDDQRVIPELLQRLGEESKKRLTRQTYIPTIATWRDLVASLRDVDFLIASRLHSGILGLIARTPLVAISFDPKVDRMMEDLGQTDYLLQIRDFAAEDVIQALDRLMFRRESPVQQIVSYLHRSAPLFGEQYDAIARLASVGHRCRNRWNKA
jgi:polysaccharide pyruvyl transferase WcaK-like protein